MNKFSLGITSIIRKIAGILCVIVVSVLFVLMLMDGSLTEVVGVEWLFGCFAVLGLTLLFGTITVSGAKKYCVQIDEESLAIIFGNKVKRVEFKDIVCVNVVNNVLLFGGSRVIIETADESFYFELDKKDLEKVKGLLPKVKDNLEKVEKMVRLTVKDKVKTLFIWIADATIYMFGICCVAVPLMLCILKKYSAFYKQAVAFLFISVAVIYVLTLILVFLVYVYKFNHYAAYELEVGGGEVVMKCKNPEARVFRTDVSQIVGITERAGIFARIRGYVTAKIITKSESKGLNEVNYLPFMIKKETAKEIRSLLIGDDGSAKFVSSGVKCDAVCFELMFVASIVSICFAILYHPIFLIVLLFEGVVYALYRKDRGYALGDEFMMFRTGSVWKKDYYVICDKVCSVTTFKDKLREALNVSAYEFDLGGYRAQLPVGVYDNELRDKIKEKIGF